MKLNSIKETCLYVLNLRETKEFYSKTLGLEVISFVEGRHVFFRIGEGVLLWFNPDATREEKVLPPHFAEGKQHIAFEVNKDEYDIWKERLKGNNIQITHEHEWKEGLFSFYFEDPSGNVLEILMPGVWD